MSQYRNLASGGFVLFLAATHVGCAGSGLKNIFTRNETDGYHSIDELEAEEQKLAETEKSSDDAESSPSIAARMASWRPFSKPDATEDEEYSAYGSDTSEQDSEVRAKSANPLSRAFAKRDSVDPDPFLETESVNKKRLDASTFKAAPDREIAKLDEKSAAAKDKVKSATVESEFVSAPESKLKSDKESKVAANKVKAKSGSNGTDLEDSDALAKRFEQHFLLNSAGAVAKSEVAESVTEGAESLQKKAATIVASADSKQRDVTGIAEKQMDAFDYLLGSDSANSDRISASKSKPTAEPLRAARRRDVVNETTTNSLAAFDNLVGADTDNSRHPVIEAAHTVTQETRHNAAAVDINVADAESLFGAAAARQNSREKRPTSGKTAQTSNKEVTDSEFRWDDTRGPKAAVERRIVHTETQGNSLSRLPSNISAGRELFHNTAFGAPSATAGNIEGDDCSIVESDVDQVPVKTASANHNQNLTTRSGRNRSSVAILPAAAESPLDGDVHFTAAPVAPVPELETTDRVAPAASRPGLIQSLSVRNWMLLIGGIVVIALLFAPGRTKTATMTNRTANG
jgi:hypothetical protein